MVPIENSPILTKVELSLGSRLLGQFKTQPNFEIVAFHQGDYIGVLRPNELRLSERLFGSYAFYSVDLNPYHSMVEVSFESKSPSHIFQIQVEIEWQVDVESLDVFAQWGRGFSVDGLFSGIEEALETRAISVLEPVGREFNIVETEDAIRAFSEALENVDLSDLGLKLKSYDVGFQSDELTKQYKTMFAQSHSDELSLSVPTKRSDIEFQVRVNYVYRIQDQPKVLSMDQDPEGLLNQLQDQIRERFEYTLEAVERHYHVTEIENLRKHLGEKAKAADFSDLGVSLNRVKIKVALDDVGKEYRDFLSQLHPCTSSFALATQDTAYDFQVKIEYAYRVETPEKIPAWKPSESKEKIEGEVESHLKEALRPVARRNSVKGIVEAEEAMNRAAQSLDLEDMGVTLERVQVQLSLDEAAQKHREDLVRLAREREVKEAQLALDSISQEHYRTILSGWQSVVAQKLAQDPNSLEEVMEMIQSQEDKVFDRRWKLFEKLESLLETKLTQSELKDLRDELLFTIRAITRPAMSGNDIAPQLAPGSKESDTDLDPSD